MYEVGNAIYREMKEYGCTYWLAPAINIHRNPLCCRNFEYFSENPRLSGMMASAITKGIQQEDGFYVTVKHYACNNQEDNRNFVSRNLSERVLREIYLRGFEYTVRDDGAKSVITSYNKVNGVYTPNSHDLCTKLLRNEWGFDISRQHLKITITSFLGVSSSAVTATMRPLFPVKRSVSGFCATVPPSNSLFPIRMWNSPSASIPPRMLRQ